MIPWFRSPGARVFANGGLLSGVIEIEVVTTRSYCADQFHVRCRVDETGLCDATFWSSEACILVEIQIAVDPPAYLSIITGYADTIALDPISRLLFVSGRDLSSKLIEARSQGTFSNQTASDVATLLATRHGLIPNVSPTTMLIGRYYQSEHNQVALDQFGHSMTDWDILTSLAQQEGFDLSVTGTTLNFCLPIQSPPRSIRPSDCISINLERRLTLARDIEITIKSWNSNQSRSFAQTVRGVSQSNIPSNNQIPQSYTYIHPNLMPTQALQMAQRKIQELAMHERAIELTLVGDMSIKAGTMLSLYETGGEFDQSYLVERVCRRISPLIGFTQEVEARTATARTIIVTNDETNIPNAI